MVTLKDQIPLLVDNLLCEITTYDGYCNAAASQDIKALIKALKNDENGRIPEIVLVTTDLGLLLEPVDILEIFIHYKDSNFFGKTNQSLVALERKNKFSLLKLIENNFDTAGLLLSNKYYGQHFPALEKLSIVLRLVKEDQFDKDKDLQMLVAEIIKDNIPVVYHF